MSERPIIAVTIGDPAGIGPEVVAKSLSDGAAAAELRRMARLLVVGDAETLQKAMRFAQAELPLERVENVDDATFPEDGLSVLDLKNVPAGLPVGRVSVEAGKAAMEAVERTMNMALEGQVKAVVTAPINKEATHEAGYPDAGHMDFYARLTRTAEHATMLVTGQMRVVHLTTHYSLRKACDLVKRERVLSKVLLTHRSFEDWGFQRPRIAVAALNPHASDGGLFGDEEEKEIGPAVEDAHAQGVEAKGPIPADSVFYRQLGGEFDVVLAMFHDQGHIPIKVHGFERSVSVALGLPFIRTSVDHGTAFDIAGKGVANAESMDEAIRVAVQIVNHEWSRPDG